MRQDKPVSRLTLVVASCVLLLSACGGGGGGGGGDSGAGGKLQVINFKYPGGNTLLNGPTMLEATATSGLPVEFSTGTPQTCTVSGNQLTLVAAGECLVYASQGGGQTPDGVQWAPADTASQLFNVLKHAQAAPRPPVAALMLGTSETVNLQATTDAGLPITYVSQSPSVCTVSGTTLALSSLGVCELDLTAPADDNYAAMTAKAFIGVGDTLPPVMQTLGLVPTIVLGATDAGGQALTYTSNTPMVCDVDGRDLQFLGKGTCRIDVAGGAGGAASFSVVVDPRFFSSGFNSTLKRTAEYGEIGMGAGVPIASWCGGADPSYCNVTMDSFSATGGFNIKPVSNTQWTGSTTNWWSYYGFQIGAPRQRVAQEDGSSRYDLLPFDLTTEESLFVTFGINPTLKEVTSDAFVRIQTTHAATKANGDACFVTVSIHVLDVTIAPKGYLLPLENFAVTENCDIAGMPKTEGWMFDWNVTAESKAAALAEIRAHGIRQVEFGPGSVNLTKPTPNADGSIPATNDPAYELSTGITVYGPITVQ